MMGKGVFSKGFAGESISAKFYEELCEKVIENSGSGEEDILQILPKGEYSNIVMKQRALFVQKNFATTLDKLFKGLAEDALKMKVCHREVEFDIPSHFDIVKTEAILCAYFIDLGYKALPEGRKDKGEDNTKINLTLT